MQSNKKFFDGLEEIFARLLGGVLSLIFFLIYISAVETMTIDWKLAMVLLGIFWLVYETVSLILFSVFSFFAKEKRNQVPVNSTDSTPTGTDNPSYLSQNSDPKTEGTDISDSNVE